MCAYTGGSAPSARSSMSCRGVFDTWSCPRTTCVMPMSRSSTATARLYSGLPSERWITKSLMAEYGFVMSPSTTSRNVISPSSGTRKRTAPSSSYACPDSSSCPTAAWWLSRRSHCETGPSSQSSSSQRSASRMASTFSGVERSRSVSSMRSTNSPPDPRARSQLYSAVLAPPMCSTPVGEGAKRTLIGSDASWSTRVYGRRPRAGARARRRAWLRGDAGVQPVPTHVASHALEAERRGRVPRTSEVEPDQVRDDPRRLPDQPGHEGPEDAQEVGGLAHPRTAHGRRDQGRRRGGPSRLNRRRAARRGAAPSGRDGETRAVRVRQLPPAAREHRGRREHARPLIRGAARADRPVRRPQAHRALPRLVPPLGVGLRRRDGGQARRADRQLREDDRAAAPQVPPRERLAHATRLEPRPPRPTRRRRARPARLRGLPVRAPLREAAGAVRGPGRGRARAGEGRRGQAEEAARSGAALAQAARLAGEACRHADDAVHDGSLELLEHRFAGRSPASDAEDRHRRRRDVPVAVETEVSEDAVPYLGPADLLEHRRACPVGARDRVEHQLGGLRGGQQALLR